MFLNRVEECRDLAKMSEEEMLSSLFELFAGVAATWFQNNKANWSTWSEFCASARKWYGANRRFQQRILQEATARTQGREEPVRDFITCLLSILKKIEPPLPLARSPAGHPAPQFTTRSPAHGEKSRLRRHRLTVGCASKPSSPSRRKNLTESHRPRSRASFPRPLRGTELDSLSVQNARSRGEAGTPADAEPCAVCSASSEIFLSQKEKEGSRRGEK